MDYQFPDRISLSVVTFLLRIDEVPGLHLGPDAGCRD
jgi:hypothetical protein